MIRPGKIMSNVVNAIAEAEDCSPEDLEYSLYEHMETEALLTLAASDHTDWRLTFTVPDHTVEVRGNGRILVDDILIRDRTRKTNQNTNVSQKT